MDLPRRSVCLQNDFQKCDYFFFVYKLLLTVELMQRTYHCEEISLGLCLFENVLSVLYHNQFKLGLHSCHKEI